MCLQAKRKATPRLKKKRKCSTAQDATLLEIEEGLTNKLKKIYRTDEPDTNVQVTRAVKLDDATVCQPENETNVAREIDPTDCEIDDTSRAQDATLLEIEEGSTNKLKKIYRTDEPDTNVQVTRAVKLDDATVCQPENETNVAREIDPTDYEIDDTSRDQEASTDKNANNIGQYSFDITPLNELNDEELNFSGNGDKSCIDFVRMDYLNDMLHQFSPFPTNCDLNEIHLDLPTLDYSDDDLNKDRDYEVESSDSNSSSDESHEDDDHDTSKRSLNNSTNVTISCSPGGLDDLSLNALPKGVSKSKLNFCYYCKTLQTVISRHLETVHKNEEEVKKFASLPKGNPERRKIIETIRLNGNYLHNKVPEYNRNGQLIVPRRPKEKRSATCYRLCHNCRGTYLSKTIRRHRQRCLGESSKSNQSNTILSRKIAGRLHPKAGDQLRNVIFCVMREDDIVRLIRYDELLIIFANMMCLKYRKQQQHDLIRARLRLLGRLLRTVKLINANITDFASIFHPMFYDDILSSIDKEARFNKDTGEHDVPSVVTTLGMYLKTVGEIFIVDCIKNGKAEKKQLTEDFLKVHKASYSSRLNKHAAEVQTKKNRLQQKPLPLTNDIHKLQSYLKDRFNSIFENLTTQFSYEKWLELSKLTLVRIFVFNRRRTGEIERISVQDLNSRQKISRETNPDQYNSLSEAEQALVEKYVRVAICGKLGRTVPVLLSAEIEASINLILRYRSSARVHEKNPFNFGVPGYDCGRFKHLRAYQLLKIFAEQCGAEYPDRLRGTLLRKHMATLCASENVNENKIHDIATFMGHEDAIHRRHYRQTVVSRGVCGVSQSLERANGVDSNQSDNDDQSNLCVATEEASDSSDDDSTEMTTNKLKSIRKLCSKANVLKKSQNNPAAFEDSVSATKRKVRWTISEKNAAWSTFKANIEQAKLPSADSIRTFLKKNSCVQRTEAQVRTWASNQIKASK